MKDKKNNNYTIIGISILVLFIIFIFASRTPKKNVNSKFFNGETASEISEKYRIATFHESSGIENDMISKGGSYTVTGAHNCITVDTSDHVQLILVNADITCTKGPGISIKNADTVFFMINGENRITSTSTEKFEGAIYSPSDLVFSGEGSLTIASSESGIVTDDTLVINGGTYIITSQKTGMKANNNFAVVAGIINIDAKGKGIEARNSENSSLGYMVIDGGTFQINSEQEGISAATDLNIQQGTVTIETKGEVKGVSSKAIHAKNSINIIGGAYYIKSTEDGLYSEGNIEIENGSVTINARNDAIHATTLLEVFDGYYAVASKTGFIGTYIIINRGTFTISTVNQAIFASKKSVAYYPTIEINGGELSIEIISDNYNAIHSKGDLFINDGTLILKAKSPFYYGRKVDFKKGTIYVNGTEIKTIKKTPRKE